MLGFLYTVNYHINSMRESYMTSSLLASINLQVTKEVKIRSDEEVTTRVTKTINPEIPRFRRIAMCPSVDATLCHKVLDSRDTFMKLSTNATWLMWTLDKGRNPKDNITRLQPKTLSPADKARYVRAKKELEHMNVIIPTKSTYFMMNPVVFLPDNKTFDDVVKAWLALGGKIA